MIDPWTITKTALEAVAIGSRLAGENPQPWDYDDELPLPVQADWSLVTFSMKREDGSEIQVEMMRPTDFWNPQGAVPGAQVFMEFSELELSTQALVRKVEPCPAIAGGVGNVVTARIITLTATDLVELTLVSGETIVGTPLHPIWSVEAQDWINLGAMQPGDAVWTEAGPEEVASVSLRSTAETVYNIEVHGHHIYQIGDMGVLVHNAGLKYRSNHIYAFYEKATGQIVKYGISAGKITKGTVNSLGKIVGQRSYRATAQLKALQAKYKTGEPSSFIVAKNITRAKALKLEKAKVTGFAKAKLQSTGKALRPEGNAFPHFDRKYY